MRCIELVEMTVARRLEGTGQLEKLWISGW